MAIEWKKNDLPTLAQKVADDASETCQNFIYAGIDVELSDGTQHFSLMPNDQTNIDSMFAAITLGASEYPYHPDGGKCVTTTPSRRPLSRAIRPTRTSRTRFTKDAPAATT